MTVSKSANGRFTGPCEIALKWMPIEISIVSVPADATVGVGRELEERAEAPAATMLEVFQRQIELNKNYL